MKKFALIAVVLLVAVTLCGCVTLRNYNDDIDPETVSGIDVYDLRPDYYWKNGSFVGQTDPVYSLPEDQIEPFLDSLGEIRFTDTLVLLPIPMDPSFSYGNWVVRLNFTDGSYRLVSCAGYGESFDSDGEIVDSEHYGCDDEVWEEFIARYVPKEILNAPEEITTAE